MDQFSAHLDRGWDLISRGDFAGAKLSAEKSLELDTEAPEAYNLLGYIQAAQGHAEDALEHYRQAIELDETFVEAMLNAAEVLIHPLHDFDAALELVDDALDLAETDDEIADTLLVKFDIHMHRGDEAAAAQVARELPRGPFENARLDFLLGRACFEVGDLESAEPLLVRAVEREPRNPDAYYYLALLRDAQEDSRAATVAFLRSRELDLAQPPPGNSLTQAQFEARVQAAIHRLPEPMRKVLEGALVVVGAMPGPEIVADGVDPRAPLLLDDHEAREGAPRVGRLFVYQRNVERMAADLVELEEELAQGLQQELVHTFPGLTAPAPDDEPR